MNKVAQYLSISFSHTTYATVSLHTTGRGGRGRGADGAADDEGIMFNKYNHMQKIG